MQYTTSRLQGSIIACRLGAFQDLFLFFLAGIRSPLVLREIKKKKSGASSIDCFAGQGGEDVSLPKHFFNDNFKVLWGKDLMEIFLLQAADWRMRVWRRAEREREKETQMEVQRK